MEDMDIMTIGMCLEFIDEYIDAKDPDKQKQANTRKATQSDFDAFSGVH